MRFGAPASLATLHREIEPMHAAAGFSEADRQSIRRAGRMVASIEGMWCASCALAVERIIARVPGVTSASISFAGGSALIRWNPGSFDLDELLSRVERLGYRIVPLIEADQMERRIDAEARSVWMRLAIAVFFGMWSMLGSLALYIDVGLAHAPQGWWVALGTMVAAVPALTYSAWAFYRAGWRTLLAGVPGMDALVSLGVLAASLLSVWQLVLGSTQVYVDTATMLVGFLLCGRLIELYARRRNSAAVSALRRTVPEIARRMDEHGFTSEVPVDGVSIGDRVLVYAGERIAVDGTVLYGESAVDRALVTGESVPVAVGPGDRVEAGCINLSCVIEVRVDKACGQRFIDRIGIRMLELFGEKSTVALQAERFARWLIPVATGLAALTFFFAYLATGDTDHAALRALSVLVAACPCAVGLALPLAYSVSVASAARHGILFRDPASLEALASAKEIQFDKTGTLTHGKLAVADVISGPCSTAEVLQWAALAESGIAHPIARAIRETIPDGRQPGSAAAVVGHLQGKAQRHGRGAQWQSDDGRHAVLVGSAAWLATYEIDVPATPVPASGEVQGTRIEVALDGKWIGTLLMTDRVRDDAREAIAAFRLGRLTTRLVTGDAAGAAYAVAKAVGLEPAQVHTGCQPEDKAIIASQARRPVVFVGDGVNDALALAAANCGVAVHGATPAAVATAGVVVADGGLNSVVAAWRHARRTIGIVQQNLILSMVYNIGILSLAATGIVPPVAAAGAMLASSVSVLANTTRLAVFQTHAP